MATAREVIKQADAAKDDVTVLSLFADWLERHADAAFLEVRFGADRWSVPKAVRGPFTDTLRTLVTETLEQRTAEAAALEARLEAADI